MAEPIIVEVVSPEKVLYSGEADMVITRTEGGGEIAFFFVHPNNTVFQNQRVRKTLCKCFIGSGIGNKYVSH